MHRHPLAPAWALPLLFVSVVGFAPVSLMAATFDQELPPSRFDRVVASMIGRPSVIREIGISKEVLEKIGAEERILFQQSIPRIGSTAAAMKERGVPVKERVEYENREKEAYYQKSAALTLGHLSPQQRARLREIALQRYGTLALADPSIARAVGIPEPKRIRIAAIRKDLDRELLYNQQADFRRHRSNMENGFGLPPKERSEYQNLSKQARTTGLAMKQWKRMAGLEDRMRRAMGIPKANPTQKVDRQAWQRHTRRVDALLTSPEWASWRKQLGKPLPPVPSERYVY